MSDAYIILYHNKCNFILHYQSHLSCKVATNHCFYYLPKQVIVQFMEGNVCSYASSNLRLNFGV